MSVPKKKLVRGPSDSRQQIEARILRAAERVFAKHGYNGSSMEAIAAGAKLSKQNLIYYFSSKKVLYRHVLQNVIDLWMEKLALLETQTGSPRDSMKRYLRDKIELSRDYPNASRVFAQEINSGAPVLKDYLLSEVKPQFERDVALIQSWIDQGLVKAISPEHFIFTVWAATQTYADFATQIHLLLGKKKLNDDDFDNAYEFLCQTLLAPFVDSAT